MTFSVEVASVDFKFSSGHFVAFRGFRERLHGHNYTVAIRLHAEKGVHPAEDRTIPSAAGPSGGASETIRSDGYVIDFGIVKKHVKAACKELNEYILLPKNAPEDVLSFNYKKEAPTNNAFQVEITTEDGSFFSLPESDCKFLPIRHTTAEEIGDWLLDDIMERLQTEARPELVELANKEGREHSYLRDERRIKAIEIDVFERPIQKATIRKDIY